jgi:hypothetical protein
MLTLFLQSIPDNIILTRLRMATNKIITIAIITVLVLLILAVIISKFR